MRSREVCFRLGQPESATTTRSARWRTSGGRLYVGGTFARIGGRDINRLAALDQATGAVQLGFAPRPDGSVKALTVSPDGQRVYAGGLFDNIGGRTETRCRRGHDRQPER